MSLNGFLVDVRCVSESNLDVEIDCSHLDWGEYRKLILELEDLLSDIDERHSVRSWLMKGRGLRAHYRRISAEERQRRLRFSPLPSKFTSILKNTRAQIYGLVAENCLVLESVGKRKVYLLPKRIAPFFVEAIDRINSEVIEPLRKEVEDFRKSDDYLKIEQCLYNHKVDPTTLKTAVFPIGNFLVDVLPVDFGYSISSDEAFAKMERARAVKGLGILDKQIERKRREYALSAVSDLVSKIVELAEAAEAGKRVRNSQKRVERLMEICRSLGFEELSDKVLEPLRQIFVARSYKRSKLAEEFFGTSDIKDGVEGAIKTLQLLEE